MLSVTQRISQIKQPKGEDVSPRTLSKYPLETINELNQDETYTCLNVFENISPQVQYVTHDSNIIDGDGIEKLKISIIIEFDINDVKFSIPYVFDEYVTVNQDY